ncbi:MAG TPA: cytochrome c [Cyclobacteriaceae bacterium]|nr:cytochrome c [Cyclobacteriaceae bacterium]
MTRNISQDDKWQVPEKYVKMKNPFAVNPDPDQAGKRLYAIHCKSCHGTKGKGDGTKAAELKTKIPDFSAPGFKSESDGSVYYKTVFGRDEMPNFEKKITTEEDRWLLVNFIKKL